MVVKRGVSVILDGLHSGSGWHLPDVGLSSQSWTRARGMHLEHWVRWENKPSRSLRQIQIHFTGWKAQASN